MIKGSGTTGSCVIKGKGEASSWSQEESISGMKGTEGEKGTKALERGTVVFKTGDDTPTEDDTAGRDETPATQKVRFAL